MQCIKSSLKLLFAVFVAAIAAMTLALSQTSAATMPKKGSTYSGSAKCTSRSIQWYGSVPSQLNSTAKIKCTSGTFDNVSVTTHCQDASKGFPTVGMKFTYKAKVTSVNSTTGKVKATFTFTPKNSAYQRMKGTGTKTFKVKVAIKVKKSSSNTAITSGNSNYSLAGATYGLYKEKACKTKVGTFTIKADGSSNTISGLKKGTYYIKELKAGKNYKLDSTVYSVKATTGGKTVTRKVTDAPECTTKLLNLYKKSNDPDYKKPLKGAQFEVIYKEGNRSWVFETDENGEFKIDSSSKMISGNAFYTDNSGKVVFPLGKYLVREIKAPDGYSITPLYDSFTNSLTIESYITVSEAKARGDIKFTKIGESQKEKDVCTTCEADITSDSDDVRAEKHGKNYYCSACGIEALASHDKEDIEKHIKEKHAAVSDLAAKGSEDGKTVSLTWGKTGANSYDIYYSIDKKKYVKIDSTKTESYEDTKFLTEDEEGKAVTSYYAVVPHYGEYTGTSSVAEFTPEASDNTEEKDAKTEDSKEKASNEESKNTEEVKDNEQNSEEDSKQDAEEEDKNSEDKDSEDKEDSDSEHHDMTDAKEISSIEVETLDGVRVTKSAYADQFDKNPLANVTFKITNNDTGESHEAITDENGNYDSSKDDNIWFGNKDSEGGHLEAGSYTISELKCNANGGYKLMEPVDFTISTDGKVVDLGTFTNIKNLIYTTATAPSGDHITYGKGTITINDKVEYEGLEAGKEYTITGTLMDKETGKEFLDADGNKITSTKTFTPEGTDGSVNVVFTFDGTKVALGHTLVAFEKLEQDKTLVAVHESITDQDQTVTVPNVGTKALTNDDLNLLDGTGTQTIRDTVKYEGVLEGKNYTIKGWLVTKDGKKIDGSEVSKTFTAEKTSGEVEMDLTFDASKYAGQDVVVFEELYYNGVLVGDHKDTEDSDQTIQVSKVGTKAINTDMKANVLTENGTQKITDTVSYENLIVGKSYTLKGWLVDGDSEKIEGTEVEKTFTAEKADGTVDMDLTFEQDSETPEDKVTVFEELYLDDVLVGQHKDVTNEDQSLTTVKIGTKAIAADSKTQETAGNETEKKIIDTIAYEGLTRGESYVAKGWLVDEDGNKIEGTDAEQKFTAEDSKGEVQVTLKFDATKYAGDDVHVFEEVYKDGVLIGEHKDKDEPSQTVHVISINTAASDEDLGTGMTAQNGKRNINDSVSYENLEVGKKYTLKSWVVNKATGDKVAGTDSTTEFIPEEQDTEEDSIDEGEKDEINTEDQDDNDAVSDQTDNDNTDNEDADQNDEDSLSGGDKTDADQTDKDDSKVETVANRVNDVVDASITLNTKGLEGETLVVFQEVYDENGNLIGEHKDLSATQQYIVVPELHTTASANSVKNLVQGSGDQVVKDTLAFKNLTADPTAKMTYEITSYLVTADGEKIDGTEKVTKFIPQAGSGKVTVEMTVDTDKLKGEDKIIAFEEVRLDGKLVASHKDVNDKDQTVTLSEFPNTGDKKRAGIFLVIILAAAAGTAGTVYYKKRKSSK